MSRPLARLAAAFVAPAPDTAERSDHDARAEDLHTPSIGAAKVRPTPAATQVGVVARPVDAAVAGCAVGLVLARPAAIVALWGAAAPKAHAPASLRARRTAARLAARGHTARAAGRLATVALADASEAARVAAAAGDLPVVCVVAGPRDPHADAVLAACDRVVIVGDDPVAQLAHESVAALGVPSRALVLPDGPSRALAAGGAALVAPLRAAVLEALR